MVVRRVDLRGRLVDQPRGLEIVVLGGEKSKDGLTEDEVADVVADQVLGEGGLGGSDPERVFVRANENPGDGRRSSTAVDAGPSGSADGTNGRRRHTGGRAATINRAIGPVT